jgi:hypothetical protein
MDGMMRASLLVVATVLLLCLAGCGGGPREAEVEALLAERAGASDTVTETLILPVTVAQPSKRGLLDALESAGYVVLGECTQGVSSSGKEWIRCPVELTEKGTRELTPYRLGAQIRIPISEPRYRITGKKRKGERLFFAYAREAVPSRIREDLGVHGYDGPLICGSGFVVYSPRDGEWAFSGLQGRLKRPCR